MHPNRAVHSSKGVGAFFEAFCQTLRGIAPLGVHLHTKADLLRRSIIDESTVVSLVLGTALFLYFLVRAGGFEQEFQSTTSRYPLLNRQT